MTKSSHTTQGGNVWTTYPQTYARNMKWLSWNQASRVLLSAGNELAHLQRGVRECLLWLWVGASWTDSRSVSIYINNTVTVTYTVYQSEPEIHQPISSTANQYGNQHPCSLFLTTCSPDCHVCRFLLNDTALFDERVTITCVISVSNPLEIQRLVLFWFGLA